MQVRVYQNTKWPFDYYLIDQAGHTIHEEDSAVCSTSWKNLDDFNDLRGIRQKDREDFQKTRDEQRKKLFMFAAAWELKAVATSALNEQLVANLIQKEVIPND